MRRCAAALARWWRRLTGTASAAAVALGLLACLCTLLAVVGPRAAAELRTTAFRQYATAAPAAEKTVTGGMSDSVMNTGQATGLSAEQIGHIEDQLRRNLRGLPLAPASADWSSLTTPMVVVADNAPSARAFLPPKIELSYRDALASSVRVLAGRLPAGQPGSGATAVLQVAVTQANASRFGLKVGSRLALPGTSIILAVSGIIRPRDPSAPFWTADPAVTAPQLVIIGNTDYWTGGFFIGPGALGAVQGGFNTTGIQLSWTFPLELGQLTAAQASQLRPLLAGDLSTAGRLVTTTIGSRCSAESRSKPGQPPRFTLHCSQSRVPIPLVVTTASGAQGLIGGFESEASSVGSVQDLLSVSLAVLAAAVLLLAGWLLAAQRRAEFALLRARGAARRQLALVTCGATAVTVLPGAAVGAAIAVTLTPTGQVPLSWWLAGLVVLAPLVGPAAITIGIHRGFAQAAGPDTPPGRLAAVRRVIVEATLVLGAAGGLIVLREQGLGRGDVYPSAGPALLAIGVAVIVLRIYPLAVRGLLALASRRSRAAAFLGLVSAARVPASAMLPAFAMVLALALVSFAGMVRGAVSRGEAAASWQQAGADAVVTLSGPVSPALQRAVAAVPGVRHVATAGLAVGSRPLAGAAEFAVLLVDPAQYGAVLSGSPLPPPPKLFSASGGAHGAARLAPVLASPDRSEQLGDSPVTVQLDGGQLVRVRVAGQAPAMSAVAAIGGSGYLVLSRDVARGAAPPAGALLIAGQGIDSAALRAAVARYGAGASIVLRSALLTKLQAAPLQHGTSLALELSAVAAACCCLLALLLMLLLSAPSRRQTLARLATMGMSARQARTLELTELLPQLLAVLAGGLACAIALVPALGPALQLANITGSASGVPVRVEPAWLAGTAVGLLILALAALTGQTMLTERDAARSLRAGE